MEFIWITNRRVVYTEWNNRNKGLSLCALNRSADAGQDLDKEYGERKPSYSNDTQSQIFQVVTLPIFLFLWVFCTLFFAQWSKFDHNSKLIFFVAFRTPPPHKL